MAIVNSFVGLSHCIYCIYIQTDMSVRPYQFEPLKKFAPNISGNSEAATRKCSSK